VEELEKQVNQLKNKLADYSLQSYAEENQVGLEDLDLDESINIVCLGPGGAGKSTILNSLFAITGEKWRDFRVTRDSKESVSTDLYKASFPGNENLRLWDIWGWTEKHTYSEVLLSTVLNGQLEEGFDYDNATDNILSRQNQKKFSAADRVHAVVAVFPSNRTDLKGEIETMTKWFTSLNDKGRPCVVLLTKVDCDDERILKDKSMIFKSDIVEILINQFQQKTGIPQSCIIPCVSFRSKDDYKFHADVPDQHKNFLILQYVALKAFESAIEQAETYIFNEIIRPSRKNLKSPRKESPRKEKEPSRKEPSRNEPSRKDPPRKEQMAQKPPTKEEHVEEVKSGKREPVLIEVDSEVKGAVDLDLGCLLVEIRSIVDKEIGSFSSFSRSLGKVSVPVTRRQETEYSASVVVTTNSDGIKTLKLTS